MVGKLAARILLLGVFISVSGQWSAAQVPAAPLVIQKIVASPAEGPANVGEIVNFQIILTNAMPDHAIVQLMLLDTFPSTQLEFVSATPETTSVDVMQSLILWSDLTETLGDLGQKQSFVVSVNFRAIAPSTIAPAVNTASASGLDDLQNQIIATPANANISIVAQCGPDPYEPNGDVKNAKPLVLDQPVRGYICPADDKDVFSLSVRGAGSYYISLYNLPADYQLYVRNMAGAIVGSSENTGTSPEEVQIQTLVAAQYFVEVVGNHTFSASRPYELKATRPTFGGDSFGDGLVEPSGRLMLSGMNLPTGLPAVQHKMRFYMDAAMMGSLLGETPLLPNGRFNMAVQIPAGLTGAHQIVGQLVQNDNVLDELRHPINVDFLPGKMQLWVDDAWLAAPDFTMPVVNKVIPRSNNPFGPTLVDVACLFQALNYTSPTVKLRIQVQGDKFGTPRKVFIRNGFNGSEVNQAFTAHAGGLYEVEIPTPGEDDEKHIVFRFGIPPTLASPQFVNITGAALSPADNSVLREVTQPRKIRLQKGYDCVIFLNRNTLFRDLSPKSRIRVKNKVPDLLAELYIHSANSGVYGVHDRRATIYYVDRYRTEDYVANWNNMDIDYSSEWTANKTARAIWLFMQRAMEDFTLLKPANVMIVGNDGQFPFYRMTDPYGDEKSWQSSGGNNPAIIVTRNNMYFTDNYYAWHIGIPWDDHWSNGFTNLSIGRIIGDGVEDMKNFYLRGIMRNGGTNRAVMASVSGVELGYLPHNGQLGGHEDYLNVPARLAARGFGVFNDNETPKTIEIAWPSNADQPNWTTAFKNAANAGMDLFFIGGHNSYDKALIPGDNFTADDTPSKYTRFDDDNPITMIIGCHGGLPVPNMGTWPGGAGSSMVYDVIRSGARAYYGASGYSYASVEDYHNTLWCELLMQHIFHVFTQSSNMSSTLGYAVRRGKITFPFGFYNRYGSQYAPLDQKTVTEFNLFGVPWQRWAYPGSGGSGAASMAASLAAKTKSSEMLPGMARERALLLALRPTIKSLGFNTYQQTFHITTGPWTQTTSNGFDLLLLPDGEQQYIPEAPVLPALTPFSIALPSSGSILNVAVDNLTTQTLGTFNIPSAKIAPAVEGGITMTADTTINAIWPPQIAGMHEGGERHFMLTVFPIRHNPTTDETILHEEFDVVVTYEAPVAFGILNFAAAEDVVGAGVTPAFTADVFNMGDAGAALDGAVTIRDMDTSAVMDIKSLAVALPSGAVYPLASSATAPLPAGTYEAQIILSDASNNTVAARDTIEVAEAQMSNLTAVFDVGTGLTSFSVDAKSFLGNSGTLEVAFAVSKVDEEPLGVVTTTPATLDAGATISVPGTWAPNGSTANMTCLVEAVGALDGKPLNSVKASFAVFTPEGLLDALINHILERELMSSTELQTADLNHDGKIDSADVILAVNMLPTPTKK